MPIGVPTRTATIVMIRLPTMAFSSPPLLPGAGVISVKVAATSPGTPFMMRTPRIHASHASPKAEAA